MKADFTAGPDKDHILITPETTKEMADLATWSNCIITAKLTEVVTVEGKEPALHLCREI